MTVTPRRDQGCYRAPGQAALLRPNTAATLSTAQKVARCDELFEAHRDLLPHSPADLTRS